MRLWRRLHYFLHARRIEEELAEEIRLHRELAGANFGNETLVLEDSRAVWRFGRLDELLRNIRYALRGFRNSPGFTLTVIGTLALGLGVLAASFSVFNSMVLQPFAVRDPHSLYAFVGWGPHKGSSFGSRGIFSWNEFLDFRRENRVFSEVLGYQSGTVSVERKRASVQAVTGNYFAMLGGRICMGRALAGVDDRSGEGVAVASYAAWKNRFGADPRIVGKTMRLREKPVVIVGVACPEFNGPQKERIDFWVSLPLSGDLAERAVEFREGPNRTLVTVPIDFPRLRIIGRLRPELTKESAEAALLTHGRQIYRAWTDWGARPPESAIIEQQATSFPLNRDTLRIFTPTFVAFGLVLLIACANVSNMLLARGLARQREIGIRISLGAGRTRMVCQLLTESLLLAIPSAVAGLGVAYGIIRAGYWMQTTILPASGVGRVFGLSKTIGAKVDLADSLPDLKILAFLCVTALITALVFGLVPALQTTRSRLVQANRGEFESGCRPARLRSALVLLQTILCALLLILAGVAMRNEMRIASQDLGMDIRGVFSISTSDKVERSLVLDRLSALAITDSIGFCSSPPLDTKTMVGYNPGKWIGENGISDIKSGYVMVSPEYFDVYKIAVRGRKSPTEFINARANSPDRMEVIVSETFARRLWPSGNAVGRSTAWEVQVGKTGQTLKWNFLVIGIAGDSAHDLYDATGAPIPNRELVYQVVPAALWKLAGQEGPFQGSQSRIVVRMKGNPGPARILVQKTMEAITPGDTHYQIESAREMLDRFLYPYRALAVIAGFLGALALLLTASGVFGMLSYVVTQRRKEFGIRLALGAGKAGVIGMVLRQSLRLAAVGSVVGALAALAVARVVSRHINQIDLFDAGGYTAALLLVIIAAMAASWFPARRAVNVDPATTLHCD